MKKKRKTAEEQLKQLGLQQISITDVMYPDRKQTSKTTNKEEKQGDN